MKRAIQTLLSLFVIILVLLPNIATAQYAYPDTVRYDIGDGVYMLDVGYGIKEASKSSACTRVSIASKIFYPGNIWQTLETGNISSSLVCGDPNFVVWTLSSTPATVFTGTINGGVNISVDVVPTQNGEHRFKIVATDTVSFSGSSSTRTNIFVVQVGAPNGGAPPYANNFTIPDVLAGSTVPIDLYSNGLNSGDVDTPTNALRFDIVSQPTNGLLSEYSDSDQFLKYKAPANFQGSDNFSYQVYDGDSFSRIATVTIVVTNGTVWVLDVGLTADDSSVITGGSTILRATVAYADACTATGPAGWVDFIANSVSNRNQVSLYDYNTGALSSPQTYSITCTLGTDQSKTATVSVGVDAIGLSVEAGGPYFTTLPDKTIPISGSFKITNPPAVFTPSYLWEKVSGPGSVSFSDNTSPSPNATFSMSGDYVISFTVTVDGVSSTDVASVTIYPEIIQNRPPQGAVYWDETAQTYEHWESLGEFMDPDGDPLSLVLPDPNTNPPWMNFSFTEGPINVWKLLIDGTSTVGGIYNDISWEVTDGKKGGTIAFKFNLNVSGDSLSCETKIVATVLTVYPWVISQSCGSFDSFTKEGDYPPNLDIKPVGGTAVISANYYEAKSYKYSVSLQNNGVTIAIINFHIVAVSGVDNEEETDTPTEFALLGNYPNPFNPTTTISFDLPISSSVRVEVVNILGRVVDYYEDNMSAGNHTWQFDAGNLPSGIYLYRLATDSGVKVGKMILQK